MATESMKVSAEVAAATTTYADVYPPTSTAYANATSQNVLVGGSVEAISNYNVVGAAVRPEDYDTLEIINAWSNESGSANVVYGVQTSADGSNWINHTTSSAPVTAVGVTRLSVTDFQKFLRLYFTNSGTGTIDVSSALTFKKKVA